MSKYKTWVDRDIENGVEGTTMMAADAERWDATTEQMATLAAGGELALQFDGTVDTYKAVMKSWFLERGADTATPEELTALCDEWYQVSRSSWVGYCEAYQTDQSSAATVTKGGDNAGMTATPSTDTVANQDDYAGDPFFACVDVNAIVDADTLKPVITAIDGISPTFQRDNPNVFVGVMQMAGYIFKQENATTYIRGVSTYSDIPYANVRPYVRDPDGSARLWIVNAKYSSGYSADNKLNSCAGVIPWGFTSHNTSQTRAKNIGPQYSGYCSVDLTFLDMMAWIKYGLTLDGVMAGCLSMNYQYAAQVAETGVKRIILSTANAANLEVGMAVILGNYAGNTDRGQSAMYSITGNKGAVISKIEDVTIDGTTYTAVYVETDDVFDTAANGAAVTGTTYLSSWFWPTGTTDSVKGNDGSPVSNTSAKYPFKLQGIEVMNGGYEVLSDTILSQYVDEYGTYWYEPYVVALAADQATSLTDNYRASGLKCRQQDGDAAAWNYIKKNDISKTGITFPIEVGGSSTTYTRDAFYQTAGGTTGTKEMLVRGNLSNGTSRGGLSCVSGAALSTGNWSFLARLSFHGNRGESAA